MAFESPVYPDTRYEQVVYTELTRLYAKIYKLDSVDEMLKDAVAARNMNGWSDLTAVFETLVVLGGSMYIARDKLFGVELSGGDDRRFNRILLGPVVRHHIPGHRERDLH
jgi:hypothetical protein